MLLKGKNAAAFEAHVAAVEKQAGAIDIRFNAVGLHVVQNRPLVGMSLDHFLQPITEAARTHVLTATTVARRMIEQRRGVIMMLSSSTARESGFERRLQPRLRVDRVLHQEPRRRGRQIRRPGGVAAAELHAGDLIGAGGSGIGRPAGLDRTALGRLPRLAEVADTAAFIASDHAGAMTGAVVNLTCGAIVD